jgi:acetyl-CoA C-acetyltransferase
VKVDGRTPVLVGGGQVSQRVATEDARAPIDLFADAIRAAGADSGVPDLVARADTFAAVQIVSWPYPDAAALVAERLGCAPRSTVMSGNGGNSPQYLVNELGAAIARGERDVVVIGGAESMYTRWRARREPRVELTWPIDDRPACTMVIGDTRPGTNEYENAHQAIAPTTVYPLFETALRAAHGRSVDAHQKEVSELWATFAAVAADNPNAWTRNAPSAETIRTITPANRAVAFPYPKLMCSNIDVDQGAAIILSSYDTARNAGVADDRMVFLHAGADAHDHYWFSERPDLARSIAIGANVRAVTEATGIGVDDVARFDLYSCFPSAVQIALQSIGIPGPLGGDLRPITVTGGLGFAGGPVNNYVTHSIAAMADALRADPGSHGVTTALGWYVTKHSAGLWSTTPPATGYRRVDPAVTQAIVDAVPGVESAGLVDGPATVEATSVGFDREGNASLGVVAVRVADGRRALATSRDTPFLASLTDEPWEGRSVRLTNDGTTTNTVHG